MDDILIYGSSLQEFIYQFDTCFTLFSEKNLRISKEKCSFFSKGTTFLGHQIMSDGIKPDSAKIQAIQS